MTGTAAEFLPWDQYVPPSACLLSNDCVQNNNILFDLYCRWSKAVIALRVLPARVLSARPEQAAYW